MNTYKAQQYLEALNLTNELQTYIKKLGTPVYDAGIITHILSTLNQIKSKTLHPGNYEERITIIINNAQMYYGNNASRLGASESENAYHNMTANLYHIRRMLDSDLNSIKQEKLFI